MDGADTVLTLPTHSLMASVVNLDAPPLLKFFKWGNIQLTLLQLLFEARPGQATRYKAIAWIPSRIQLSKSGPYVISFSLPVFGSLQSTVKTSYSGSQYALFQVMVETSPPLPHDSLRMTMAALFSHDGA